MSRKSKGAALFELLYRDKGKTTADGAMKMPSWFRTKQPGNVPGSSPVPPPMQAELANAPAPAKPAGAAASPPGKPTAVAGPMPGGEKAAPAAPAASPAPAALPGSPPALPPRLGGTIRDDSRSGILSLPKPMPGTVKPAPGGPRPAMVQGGSSASAATRPTKPPTVNVVPPWGADPWLRIENGRVRVNLTTFAAAIVLGAAVIVLLLMFIIGQHSGGEKIVYKDKIVAPPPAKTINEAREGPVASRITDGVAGHPGTGGPSHPTGPGPTDHPPTTAHPPAGNFFVIVATLGKDQSVATRVVDYLKKKNYDVVVHVSPGNGLCSVRTATGADKATADRIRGEIEAMMPQIAHDVPGTVSSKQKPIVE